MRKAIKPTMWPSWKYGPNGEAEIFDKSADVPVGWMDAPFSEDALKGPEKGRKLDPQELTEALVERGVKVDPRWPAVHLEKLLAEMTDDSTAAG